MFMKKTSGIYQIRNLLNGKVYIGSAVNIGNRWSEHKYQLNKGTHHGKHLQHSWNKYGPSNFKLEILEECNSDRESRLKLEQHYLDTVKPEYNTYLIANSNRGLKLSEEHKLKISIGNKGKVVSEESRKRMSESRKGRIVSEETRKKISESEKRTKSLKIIQKC